MNLLGFIFSSYKDYVVTSDVMDSKVDAILVSSLKDNTGYVWKRDAEGFYSDFKKTPREPWLF